MEYKVNGLNGKTVSLEMTMNDHEFDIYEKLVKLLKLHSREMTNEDYELLSDLGFSWSNDVLWTSDITHLDTCYQTLKKTLETRFYEQQSKDYMNLLLNQDVNRKGEEATKEYIRNELQKLIHNLTEELGDIQESYYLPIIQVIQEMTIKQLLNWTNWSDEPNKKENK